MICYLEKIKHVVNSKTHRCIFINILKNVNLSEKESMLDFMIDSYLNFIEHRIIFRTANITFESYFLKKNYNIKSFELFTDDIQKRIIRHKANLILKRILSSKYKFLIDFNTKYIMEEIVIHGFSPSEVQSFLGKKIILLKKSSDFNTALLTLLESKTKWNKESVFEIINEYKLIEDIDYKILKNEGHILFLEIKTFKASKHLGVKMWCISRDKIMFDNYQKKEKIFFRFNFELSFADLSSSVAGLINLQNKIHELYLKNDDFVSINNIKLKYNDIYEESKQLYPLFLNASCFIKNIIANPHLKYFLLNKDNVIDLNSHETLDFLFSESIYPMEDFDYSIFKELGDIISPSLFEEKKIGSLYDITLFVENNFHYEIFSIFSESIANTVNAIDFFEKNKENETFYPFFFDYIINNKNIDFFDYIINEEKNILKLIIPLISIEDKNSFFCNLIEINEFVLTENILYLFSVFDIDTKNKVTKKIIFKNNKNMKTILTTLIAKHNDIDKNNLINIFDLNIHDTNDEKKSSRFISMLSDKETSEFIFSNFPVNNKNKLNALLSIVFSKYGKNIKSKKIDKFFINSDSIKEHFFCVGTSGKGTSMFNDLDYFNFWFYNCYSTILEQAKKTYKNDNDFKKTVSSFFSRNKDVYNNVFSSFVHANENNIMPLINETIKFFSCYDQDIDIESIIETLKKKDAEKRPSFMLNKSINYCLLIDILKKH